MAIKFDTFKANEKEIKELCVQWMNTTWETKEHQEAETKLRKLGFTSWNFLSLFYGAIDYEDKSPEEEILPNLSNALKRLHEMTPDFAKHMKAVMKENG